MAEIQKFVVFLQFLHIFGVLVTEPDYHFRSPTNKPADTSELTSCACLDICCFTFSGETHESVGAGEEGVNWRSGDGESGQGLVHRPPQYSRGQIEVHRPD